MNGFSALFVFLVVLFIPFCSMNCIDASKNINGRNVPCIGVMGTEDPNYTYDISFWNVTMGVFSSGLAFIPPAYVVAKRLQCPSGQKPPPPVQPLPPVSITSQAPQVSPASTP